PRPRRELNRFILHALTSEWYTVDKSKIREDIMKLWIPLGAGSRHDQPDKSAEEFLARSMERSDSLPLQTWHSLARSTLSWFISRTSINGDDDDDDDNMN
ncbi:hypothetical protein PV326_011007, partial [Microctonus aethiopoides]